MIQLKEEVLKLHILYLEKVEHLSEKEKAAYLEYFNMLRNPSVIDGTPMSKSILQRVQTT